MQLKYSVKTRRWSITERPPIEKLRSIMFAGAALTEAAAAVLYNRGLDHPDVVRDFINVTPERFVLPQFLPDADKAAERIISAIKKHRPIVIYGDYDVDGVTSTVILYDYLKSLSCDVSYYIPDRITEGYGLNLKAVEKLAVDGNKLMITVDTGTSSAEEVLMAKKYKLETVVTDHHECVSQMPSCPVVNPVRPDSRYSFKGLAGVGVTAKVIMLIEQLMNGRSHMDAVELVLDRYSELIALGTVADVMPLTEENRIIVVKGLQSMKSPKNIGLRELMIAAGAAEIDQRGAFKPVKEITAATIGFNLAPKINAAGRMGSAELAVELFCETDPNKAREIAMRLCELNRERQNEEARITGDALLEIDEQCSPTDRVIVLAKEGWHHGIIGIAASRLTDRFDLPTIIISLDPEPEPESNCSKKPCGKGSARSIKGFDLARALQVCSDYLVKFGGHEMAAGLTVERDRIDDFRYAINKYADSIFWEKPLERVIDVDLELKPEEITADLVECLDHFEPTGSGNPRPVFLTTDLTILDAVPLSGGKHLKLFLKSGDRSDNYTSDKHFTAVWFGKRFEEFEFRAGDVIDVVYSLELNEYGGMSEVQLQCRDIKRTIFAPTRTQMVVLYKLLLDTEREGRHSEKLSRLADYADVRLEELIPMLRILSEIELIDVSIDTSDNVLFAIKAKKGQKTELERSPTFVQLWKDKQTHNYDSNEY